MNQPQIILLVAVINFAAAFFQGAAGFGYALMAMALMPLFLPMSVCSAISAVTVVVIGLQMTLVLCRELQWRLIVLPVFSCLTTINLGLYLLDQFDELLLRIILACLLLLVTAIFFIMRRRQLVLPNRWYTAVGAGLITGISTGMFNIVGPFFLVYYMNVCETPLSMKASLEFSFLLSGLYSSAMHLFVYHNITLEAAPMLATSAAAALLAGVLGLKVFRKIDKNKISLVAYILLPLMAVNLIITGLSV